MFRTMLATLAMSTSIAVGLGSVTAAATWQLTGVWRLNAKCQNWHDINVLTIGRADASKVLGTTNVGDGYGKIVGGSFDGVNFEFTNQYIYAVDGTRQTEYWRGKLSAGGKTMRGSWRTTNRDAVLPCTFYGSRQ